MAMMLNPLNKKPTWRALMLLRMSRLNLSKIWFRQFEGFVAQAAVQAEQMKAVDVNHPHHHHQEENDYCKLKITSNRNSSLSLRR